MAKREFSRINTKAAAITGGVIGFLCWLALVGLGFGGVPQYGFMYSMMGYYSYAGAAGLSFVAAVALGVIAGALVALVYNWALNL